MKLTAAILSAVMFVGDRTTVSPSLAGAAAVKATSIGYTDIQRNSIYLSTSTLMTVFKVNLSLLAIFEFFLHLFWKEPLQ